MMQIKADGRTVYVKVKVLQENYSFGVVFFVCLFCFCLVAFHILAKQVSCFCALCRFFFVLMSFSAGFFFFFCYMVLLFFLFFLMKLFSVKSLYKPTSQKLGTCVKCK